MTRQEMLTSFSKQRIPPSMFWLGPIQAAEEVTGRSWDGQKWLVYYREHGSLFDVVEFDSEEAANDELHKRVTTLFRMMK